MRTQQAGGEPCGGAPGYHRAAGAVIGALMLGWAGQASAAVVFQQTGTAATLDILRAPLPGAGNYRFEIDSSIPVYLSFAAGYELHWDVFLAPPPRPHHEYVEGNNYPIESYSDGVGTSFTFFFDVPETDYRFFDSTDFYTGYGIPVGTPLYEIKQYEDPYFTVFAEDADFTGREFRYAVRVTAVPEPQAWALLISGFALAGTALRARRRTTAPV